MLDRELRATLDRLAVSGDLPNGSRKAELDVIADWMRMRRAAGQTINLVFVCTHNSRRSAFAQLWAAAAASYHNLTRLRTWSAGAQATSIAEPAIEALRRGGFRFGTGQQERSFVTIVDKVPLALFSKSIDDTSLPQEGFAAIMVCSQETEACPFVPNAAVRFPLAYSDPKVSDGTPDQDRVYTARSEEIARDMLWLMGAVKSA